MVSNPHYLKSIEIRIFIALALTAPTLSWAKDYEEIYGASQTGATTKGTAGASTYAVSSPADAKNAEPSPPEITKGHQHAIELESVLAAYLTDKVEELAAIDSAESKDQKERQKGVDSDRTKELDALQKEYDLEHQQLLGPFCATSEKPYDCSERYIRTFKPTIYKTRRGMQNEADLQSKLSCTKMNRDGTCATARALTFERAELPDAPKVNKAPGGLLSDRPLLPSFTDLQDYSKNKMKSVTQQDYKNWVDSLVNPPRNRNTMLEPSIDDYVLTDQIPRDPSNPEAGNWTVIRMNENGTIQHDTKAYAIAHKAWELDQKNIQGDFKTLQDDVKNRPADSLKKSQENFNNAKDPDKDPSTAINYDILAQVRGPLVDDANKLGKKDSDKEKGKRQKTRDKNSSPAKTKYNGKEAVTTKSKPDAPGGKESTESVGGAVSYSPDSFTPRKIEEAAPIQGVTEDTIQPDQILNQ